MEWLCESIGTSPSSESSSDSSCFGSFRPVSSSSSWKRVGYLNLRVWKYVNIIGPNSRDNIHHAMIPPINSPKPALQLALKVLRLLSVGYTPEIQHGTACLLFLRSPNMNLWYGQVDFVPQEIIQPTFSIKSLKKTDMEPNAGPNWTQTAPWNNQHGIWTSYHKAICNLEGWFEG